MHEGVTGTGRAERPPAAVRNNLNSVGANKRFGRPTKSGAPATDRLATYRSFLEDPACPIVRPAGMPPEHLMYDPFDQLMRLQLLAWQMEGRELGATHAAVVHVAPTGNVELSGRITSPELRTSGDSVTKR